jgi:uncharacterized protein (TIGR02996 family)
MTTADALLAAVIASPDDDLPRLVYADHLEETGEGNRAEFIRLQCATARGDATAAHRIRERVMLQAHYADWLAPLRRQGEPLFTQKSHAVFRRGFVEAVWLPVREFVRHAGRLFDLAPVRELRVIFAAPTEVGRLVGCEHLSRLAALDVCDSRFGPAGGAELLGRNRFLTGLRTLRLPGCNIDDTGVAALCDSRLTLDLLDLRHNPLSEQARERLRQRFGDAVRFE